MSPRILRNFLAGARARVVWIEYDAYAHRVFANSAGDWLTQSTRYANTMIQARKAIRTDVLSVDLSAAGLAAAGGVGEDPVARCKAVLTDAAAQRYSMDCVEAIIHTLGEEVDLVLRVRAPRDLLLACGGDDIPDFDVLDDVGTTMVAVLRAFADKPVAGLLLTRASADALSVDEVDAYGPLWNAAHHYGWVTGLAAPSSLLDGSSDLDGIDLLLCADLAHAGLCETRGGEVKVGGGLPVDVWRRADAMPTAQDGDLLFGNIPADANPETVLANCAILAR